MKQKKKSKNKPILIDLFCGCGGLSYGFSKAGFKTILGADNWEVSLKTFKKSHPGSETESVDILHTSPEKIAKKYKIKNVDVIVGGPPCQGFSISGKRIVDDPRNKLYKAFLRFVFYFKPSAFVMENVPLFKRNRECAGKKFQIEPGRVSANDP